ncbi:MAG: hypothetical protein ACREK8_04345 [Gemmatimonadales bacterium]
MDLRESLTLERYRLAVERQQYFTGLARDAFANYAKFAVAIGAIAIGLVSARESLGLDKAVIPDAMAVLASLLVFIAIVAITQVLIGMIRWRQFRRLQIEIDPDPPSPHALWWLAEAVYLLIIVGSVILGWRTLEAFSRAASGS